jgi:PAS domain S-box-containing protein
VVEQALLQRSARLQPVAGSAREARRFVSEALAEVGESETLYAVELAVSELVTNAILHAATPMELTIEVTQIAVTVRVRDWHPRLPAQRHWDDSATTGRGLRLVASLSDEFGVDVQPPKGKSVWFRLVRGAHDTMPPAAEWDVEELLAELGSSTAKKILLSAAPARLWAAGQQHWEAVLRELYLHAQSQPGQHDLDLVGANRALAKLTAAVERAGAAEDSAPHRVDAELLVTDDELAGFAALQDALDIGLRLGADGRLLIRPALPEVVALRDWACEQVLAQAKGVPPTPWAGADHPRFVEPAVARAIGPAPAWDLSVVSTSSRAVVAADDNNRLIAVSQPAAELLGWDADHLVGRRIITIVPPRLREAHVAGFTRHLTTGETHVLGVHLELPVLRADGTEVLCGFLIERAAAEAGRAVYVAWIDPVRT